MDCSHGFGARSFPRTASDSNGFTPQQEFLVLELNSPVSEHDGAIQSPFDCTGPRERCGPNMPEFQKALACKKGKPMVRDNDTARAKAVDPPAQQRGAQTHCDGSDCEAVRDGFAAPAKFRAQRFHENRERINEQRAEARHHAQARGQHHAPAVIVEIEFTQVGVASSLCIVSL